MTTTEFQEKVYEKLRKVPRGKITTYKLLAKAVNKKSKAYRAIGTAMNKNPYAPQVPCHRVVNSDGKVGGFASGTKDKINLLKKERVFVEDGKIKDFDKVLYRF